MNTNRAGRAIGLGLIGVALLWLLRSAGALPFLNQTNNQVAASNVPQDRPLIADLDASRTGTSANLDAQNPGGNSSGGGSTTNPAGSGTSTPPTGTGQLNRPAVRAGW